MIFTTEEELEEKIKELQIKLWVFRTELNTAIDSGDSYIATEHWIDRFDRQFKKELYA